MAVYTSTPRNGNNVRPPVSFLNLQGNMDQSVINRSTFSPLMNTELRVQSGESPRDYSLDSSDETSRIIRNPRYEEDLKLAKLAARHEIHPDLSKRLKKLRGYEIVIICDDSGSMNTPMNGTYRTRWHYLMEIVKTILEIAIVFDSNGVDIYFLNRDPVLRVKDAKKVEESFVDEPAGYTPLVRVLEEVFKLPAATRNHEKKLLVIVATDGAPTDDGGFDETNKFEWLLRNRRCAETTHIQFLACTDESDQIAYLADFDQTMKNVDVIRDFIREREEVYRCRGNNTPYTRGDYIVQALLGSIDPEIDKWNDPIES